MKWEEVPFSRRVRSFVKDNYTLTVYVAYADHTLNNVIVESLDGGTQLMVQLTDAEIKESYGINV